jgi:predicted AAA+ superfamily ATPase
MKRHAIEDLIAWKSSKDKKPLVIYGARQVGKTWLVREFAKKYFTRYIEMDFYRNKEFGSFFKQDLDPKRIIKAIEAKFETTINPDDTLIFFDEIQESEEAKNSLKYFYDSAKEYNIIAAGSFLGVSDGKFPVGKTESITLYPMSFYEFLEGVGRSKLLDAIKERDTALLNGLETALVDSLKTFFYTGGMPEVVDSFSKDNDLQIVRNKQKELLLNYEEDFRKHISKTDIPKVRMLWDSIPSHLAREKKKFIYKDVKIGGRASEFENALNWLVKTGLVYKVSKTLTAKIPLNFYEEREIFKLYTLDTGLLCAKSNIDIASFYLSDNNIFSDFQGAMAEQYVLQELKQSLPDSPLYYWGRDKGDAEIDFLLQYKNELIPIEVKSTRNTKSKSLKAYCDLEKPKYAVRLSLKNFGVQDGLYSIPLYMIESLGEIVDSCNRRE